MLSDKTTEIEKDKQSKQDELRKQLEQALADKEEALAKLAIAEGRSSGSIPTNKVDQNHVDNVARALGGPPPPPMPGMGPPPPPMPGMGGPPPPPMPGMGPPPPPMPGMGGPPPPPMPGMGPPPPPMPGMGGGPPPPPMPGMGGPRPPPPPGGMPPPPFPGMVPMPGMVHPDVLPHGMKPKKKWEVSGPLKRANWKTVSCTKLVVKLLEAGSVSFATLLSSLKLFEFMFIILPLLWSLLRCPPLCSRKP